MIQVANVAKEDNAEGPAPSPSTLISRVQPHEVNVSVVFVFWRRPLYNSTLFFIVKFLW